MQESRNVGDKNVGKQKCRKVEKQESRNVEKWKFMKVEMQ